MHALVRSSRSPRTYATAALVVASAVVAPVPADAATITVAYADGHSDVLFNDYGTPALGTFRLTDGDTTLVALCLEAHVGHTTVAGAYRPVTSAVASAELDYLLWRYGTEPELDDDTATALAALGWFHAGAQRRGGGPVWADHWRGFAPISPLQPTPWHALPRFGPSSPVGLWSRGVHLDGSERRVHDLHVESIAMRGPWVLGRTQLDGRSLTVTLTGPGGPIPGREVVAEIGGVTPDRLAATTGIDGVARLALPSLADGAYVELSAAAPGPHQEWDGDGEIQRMTTATAATARTSITIPPLPHHVGISKTSSDPVIGVAGARFEVRDAAGELVTVLETDGIGRTPVATIDPADHPPPYSLREVTAPPGLAPRASDITVDGPLSTDSSSPTVVVVENHPRRRPLTVRKVLSEPDVGPRDLSGFGFEVTRVADGREVGRVVTDSAGVAPPLDVTIGDHHVCEVSRPRWADVLVDPGCSLVHVDDTEGPIGITHVNAVPPPRIRTAARDALDGDQVLAHDGGTVVDTVTYAGLVPGTEYVLVGELHDFDLDGTAVPTGLAGRATFVPARPDGTADVSIVVPPGVGFDRLVVFETLLVGDRVIADHTDPDDLAQTVSIAPPHVASTTVPESTPPATTTTTIAAVAVSPPVVRPRPLPHTGTGVTDRLADGGTVLLTAGLLLSAAAIGVRRRT